MLEITNEGAVLIVMLPPSPAGAAILHNVKLPNHNPASSHKVFGWFKYEKERISCFRQYEYHCILCRISKAT